MSYPINTGIPAAGNDPADDQPLMQANYANINSFLSVDHIAPGTTNNGYHQQVHLINEAAPGLGGADGVLYANAIGGISYPFWQNSIGSAFQLLGAVTTAQNGSVVLPGGIIIKWGRTAIPSGSVVKATQSFPVAFPTSTYVVLPTLIAPVGGNSSSNNSIAIQNNISASQFTWDYNGASGDFPFFNWIAIGI